MVNLELLNNTLELIIDNLDHWDQTAWHCGSTHCFAGFVELQVDNLPIDCHEGWFSDEHGECATKHKATKALGVHGCTANTLFSMNNSLEEIKAMVWQLNKTPDAIISHTVDVYSRVYVIYSMNDQEDRIKQSYTIEDLENYRGGLQ